eukprot:1710354-Karenia_brevis.AAC.1
MRSKCKDSGAWFLQTDDLDVLIGVRKKDAKMKACMKQQLKYRLEVVYSQESSQECCEVPTA